MSEEDEDSSSPYCVDDLGRKHESWPYGDSDSTIVKIDHDGRSIDLIVYKYSHLFKPITVGFGGELMFVLAEQLDYTCEDGRTIEGGNGLLIVARRHPQRENTYWTAVFHMIFPDMLPLLTFEGASA
jgi:hypothetical protein